MEDFGVIVSSISISLDIILNDNSPNFLVYFRWHVFRAYRSILEKSCSSYINGTRNFARTIIKRGKHVAAIFEKCSKKESWIFISIARFLDFSLNLSRKIACRGNFRVFHGRKGAWIACFCVGWLECWNAWRKAARKPIRLVAFAAYGGGQSYK